MTQTQRPRSSGEGGGHAPREADRATPEIRDEDVAERPKLAEGVELAGQMQDSGFESQPWLVLRDGGYVQLTELLYRVAEQANGERTHDEMAAGVSDAIDRKVSAENVRQLLRSKLIPLGLVEKTDGSVVPAGAAGGQRGALSVNARMMRVGRDRVYPLTAALKILWWPPVLLAAVAAAIAALGWLFLVQGVAQATRETLQGPYLIFVVLLVVLTAAFHEFGHASALEYGGGKVRGMGAGFYLMYPAFYTDVTDNYRLGRWSKVRTDLGGFYFNLITALVLIGVFLFTGWNFLLIAAMLATLEIVHQSLPFVRLDGYWALADMTGIPDFFSQIPAFLRTVLPLPWWKGSTLPNLKGWVKAVFAVYILVTVPVLLVLLFLMVTAAPRVIATALASFGTQLGTLSRAQATGDVWGMVAAVVQMVLLTVSTGGLLFFLFSLGRKLVRRVRGWSRVSAGRRALGALAGAAAAAAVVFLYAPSLPFIGGHGALYNAATFRPIGPDERGTLMDGLSGAQFSTTAPPPAGFLGSGAGPDAPVPASAPGGAEPARSPAVESDGATAVPDDAEQSDGGQPAGGQPAGGPPSGTPSDPASEATFEPPAATDESPGNAPAGTETAAPGDADGEPTPPQAQPTTAPSGEQITPPPDLAEETPSGVETTPVPEPTGETPLGENAPDVEPTVRDVVEGITPTADAATDAPGEVAPTPFAEGTPATP